MICCDAVFACNSAIMSTLAVVVVLYIDSDQWWLKLFLIVVAAWKWLPYPFSITNNIVILWSGVCGICKMKLDRIFIQWCLDMELYFDVLHCRNFRFFASFVCCDSVPFNSEICLCPYLLWADRWPCDRILTAIVHLNDCTDFFWKSLMFCGYCIFLFFVWTDGNAVI